MSDPSSSGSSFDRRPNPPGWTQPRAPYNPYDINDVRPPQGYPSEFKAPGRESSFSEIPRDASEFQKMRHTMKKLQYTPRPPSELYPGQLKVLRRIHTNARFERGVKLTSTVLTLSIATYCVFFYRWNEGFENIFSSFYRAQLQMRNRMFQNLNDVQVEDLTTIKQASYSKYIPESKVPDNIEKFESKDAMQRPTKRHLLEAERIMQERELEAMKQHDNVSIDQSGDTVNVSALEKKKKWFGLF